MMILNLKCRNLKSEYYEDKKKKSKKEINTIIDILNYNIAKIKFK